MDAKRRFLHYCSHKILHMCWCMLTCRCSASAQWGQWTGHLCSSRRTRLRRRTPGERTQRNISAKHMIIMSCENFIRRRRGMFWAQSREPKVFYFLQGSLSLRHVCQAESRHTSGEWPKLDHMHYPRLDDLALRLNTIRSAMRKKNKTQRGRQVRSGLALVSMWKP